MSFQKTFERKKSPSPFTLSIPATVRGRIDRVSAKPVVREGSAAVVLTKASRTLLPGDEQRLWAHVRSLPCALCGREGETQVSHSNALSDGKGRSLKAFCWRIAALCIACHARIDQGNDLSREDRASLWEKAHRITIGWLFQRSLVRPA